ncbi:MAG TPA: methylenetetrahydrofolate reductase [Candidatus Dormibacteraeota bacterium]
MDDSVRRTLAAWLRRPRCEVMPLAGAEEAVAAHLTPDVTVTVTAPATRGLERMLDLTERLVRRGYRVVPHLQARGVRDGAHLREVLDRLAALGTEDAFVVAGDQPEPAGRFPDALSLLEAMATQGHPFREIGIAGYPESHPFIHEDLTIQAMWDKRRFATYVVSNLCFDPRVIAAWVTRVRRRGVSLPIHVGMAGPINPTRLVRIANRIGLGESARLLRWHAGWVRLVAPGGYRPDRLLTRLAPRVADPALNVAGLHVFTFNEIAKTERWRQEWLERLGATGP